MTYLIATATRWHIKVIEIVTIKTWNIYLITIIKWINSIPLSKSSNKPQLPHSQKGNYQTLQSKNFHNINFDIHLGQVHDKE